MEFQLALLYCLGLRLGKEPAVSCINFYDKWKMRNNPFVELKSSLSCSDTKKHVYSIFSHCAFARLKFQYLWQRWLEWRTVGWRSCPRSQLKTQTKISQVGFRWRCSSKTRHPSSQLTLQFCAMCACSPPPTTTTSNSWYYGFTSWFPFLVSVICLQFSTSSVAGVEALMGCCGAWAGPSSAAPVGSSETSGQIT